MKILIIDDEDASRVVVGRMVELLGHDTVLAETGDEGLKCFRTEHFDMIFVDMMLPDVTGSMLCKEIRKKDKKVRIVIMSGSVEPHSIQDLVDDLNIETVIEKPVRVKAVKDLIDDG